MVITSTQKVIKVGSSLAVTIPAKDAKRLGIHQGDELKVVYEKQKIDAHTLEVVSVAQSLIKRHKKALKNLSQR